MQVESSDMFNTTIMKYIAGKNGWMRSTLRAHEWIDEGSEEIFIVSTPVYSCQVAKNA